MYVFTEVKTYKVEKVEIIKVVWLLKPIYGEAK